MPEAVTDDFAALSEQAERIVRSGALGRSRSYVRLLEFLVDCARAGRTPKELEIAMEVFGKSADFDPSQDSLVRVYAHNLRQKLEQYYASPERAAAGRLVLGRGEYRVSFARPGEPLSGVDAAPETPLPVAAAAPSPGAHAATPPRNRAALAVAAAVLVALGGAFGWLIGTERDDSLPPAAVVARSPLWTPIFDDDLPILVIVGDYYIFGETNDNGEVVRLVREFDINSRRELDDLMMYEPDFRDRYMDLDLTYLPRGSAFALLDVLRVLYTADKPLRIVSMSELNVADVKSSHVVYIGYLSALDKLEDFVFASSSLAIGDTYDEVRNKATGTLYASEGGAPSIDRNYRDYSFISSFPGPGGNQFMIVAGTRDAGLMQSAHALTDPGFVRAVEQALPEDGSPHLLAFEQLYEVMGFNRTNLDARLVHEAPLDYETIWGGTLLTGD